EFDTLTVAACVVYAEAGVDVAVLECGMGGRWDATSAVKSTKTVAITGIGLDHMHILGDTLEAIAGEKAAIIKAGRPCVLGVGTATPDSVEDVFLAQCAEEGVEPVLLRPEDLADARGEMHPGTPRAHEDLPHASYRVTRRPARLGLPLVLDVTTPRAAYEGLAAPKPAYQAANIACAVALAEAHLGRVLDAGKLSEAVMGCPTPGRFDMLRSDPPILIDACHNPQSVETFLTAVRDIEPDVSGRPALLCAALADKDCGGMVELLAHEFPCVYVTQTSSARALAAKELAALFREAGADVRGVYPTVAEAVSALDGQAYVACGSITLAGEVAGILR
ncbi:MAG: bifunctional folylpolyglutamate synthase/dihydrofolate synthase, partial [Atopobiaceae bacterium]|nr:bifunctional folylpolyglutamate synthase/dihydrofolate synthase [Atopobiaceae bacterium]